jgi:[ribosomal protein S5]-alanine N-acetyltransferase
MTPHPTLRTARLLLRPFEMSDAPVVASLCSDKAIASTTLFIPHPYSLADAEAWLSTHRQRFEAGTDVQFAIILADPGELIGAVGLVIQPEHDRAEIGYWIARSHWGNGFATEAGRAVLRYGFETRGLNRVWAYHYARNAASGRVLQNIGLRYEGLARQHIKKWGQYEDCPLYGLTRADYHATSHA